MQISEANDLNIDFFFNLGFGPGLALWWSDTLQYIYYTTKTSGLPPSTRTHSDMELVKKFTQARFSKTKFYPKVCNSQ